MPDATVAGAFGHPEKATLVLNDEMYAKKIMKENESEGRRWMWRNGVESA